MKIASGRKRRDCEQVALPECVRVSIMLLLAFASHIDIDCRNYIEPAQGSCERQDTITEIKGINVLHSTASQGTSMSTK